ncbi:MAG TPA: NAD-dependent deacylase [Noviherbaspirillum sp.]|jgi:NAD-dependent deacetylase|uniref:SIR2 family NAD-dependent protein deacylase n=1 Tax=Noviherbaspirillum sp. TaxID=1926288 RepID=UPI002F92A41B
MSFDTVLLEKLRSARHLVVFSGAGMSAESGIPTFRDAQTGLWAQYRAEDLATPDAFRRDPVTVWNWYAWRRAMMRERQPNAGHLAVARLERLLPEVNVITQNVDGLHQAAGSGSVIELHGNIHGSRCFDCGRTSGEADGANGIDIPPRCTYCGGMLRPAVVWFGEALPMQAWQRAEDIVTDADLFLCVGTSSLVEPAASLPRLARSRGCTVVQINPDVTAHDAIAQFVLRGKAGGVLPGLLAAAWPDDS